MPPPTDAGTFRLTSDAMHNVALSGGAQASFWLTSRVGGRVVSVRVLVDGIHLQEEWPVGGGPNPPTVTMAQLEAMAERARAAWAGPRHAEDDEHAEVYLTADGRLLRRRLGEPDV
jgi:hypothetical protein